MADKISKKACILPAAFEAATGYKLEKGESIAEAKAKIKEMALNDKGNLRRNIGRQIALKEFLEAAENPEEALMNLLRPDRVSKAHGRGTTTLEEDQATIINSAHAQLVEMMQEYKPFLGIKAITDSDARNIVRSLFGEDISDIKAGKFASMWTKVNHMLVDRFNKAGGSIKKVGDYKLPQIHAPAKIAAVSKAQWVNEIRNKLDYRKMKIHEKSDLEIQEILESVYETLSTSGLNKPLSQRNMGVSTRRNQQRFLQFKDADSWLEYQAAYGNDNVYSSLMDHITGMGKDIAIMEKFGTDPEAMFSVMADIVTKGAKDKMQAAKRIASARKIWNNSMGHTAPLQHEMKLAHRVSAIRNVITGLRLGAASIAALSDVGFLGITSVWNGMPMVRVFNRFIKNIANGKNSDFLAARLLLGMEHAIDAAHTANRYADVVGHGVSGKFADFVLRSSGLNAWTVAGKQAFGVEFLSHITETIKRGGSVKAFKLYGIDDADIKTLKGAKTFREEGIEFIDIQSLDPELQKKIVGMTLSESKMAVPEPNVGVRSFLNQGERAGTIVGEALRSGAQFKSFPVTLIMTHMARMIYQNGGPKGSLTYGAAMIASTTVMGTMAVITYDFTIRGERPTQDSLTPGLFIRGFIKGGSGSFVADLLHAQATKAGFGQGFTELIVGPLAGEFDKLFLDIAIKGIFDPMQKGGRDVDDAFIFTGTKLLEQFIPNLPFVKLIIRREVLSAFHNMGDNKWQKQQRKFARQRQKETHNEQWYAP